MSPSASGEAFGFGGAAERTSPLTGIARTLGRHRWLFTGVAAAVLAVGVPALFWAPSRYTATASVVIPPPAVDPLLAAPPAADRTENQQPATEASLIASRDVATAVVSQVGLGLTPEPSGPIRRLACEQLGLSAACPDDAPPPPPLSERVSAFMRRLNVAPASGSRLIDVSVTDSSPERAAAAADAVVSEYQKQALAERATGLNRIVGWLDARTDALRARWLDAVKAAGAFQVAHGLTEDGAASGQPDRAPGQAATSLGDAQARLAAAQARADAIVRARRGDASGMMALGDQPVVSQEATALATLQAQRAQEAAQLGSGHPALRVIDRQIAELRASLLAVTGSALRAVQAQAATARAEVAQFEHELQGFKAQAGSGASPDIQLKALQEDAQSDRTVYETFLTRERELGGRSEILDPPVVFVSHAVAPASPSGPHRGWLLAAVAALALLCAVVAVLLRARLASGFSDAVGLKATIPLPLLSVMPLMPSGRDTNLARLMVEEPFSRASEAVRTLAAHVALETAEGSTSQSVLIGSSDAGEGKSTVALWLSTIVAGGGQRVLLIDGDHRRGSIARRLNGRRTPGLVELLSGTASIGQAVQYDAVTGLDYIAAGAPTSRPFGADELARLRTLLAELKHSYPLVVIDSPPLLGMSDALVYARLADQTVFVCRWRDTSRAMVMNCLEQLHRAGARLTGLVMSMVDPNSALAYGGDYAKREVRDVARLYGSP